MKWLGYSNDFNSWILLKVLQNLSNIMADYIIKCVEKLHSDICDK